MIFLSKDFVQSNKMFYLCTRIQPTGVRTLLGLCYGVMVTQQVLVLLFPVRIRVVQPHRRFIPQKI